MLFASEMTKKVFPSHSFPFPIALPTPYYPLVESSYALEVYKDLYQDLLTWLHPF